MSSDAVLDCLATTSSLDGINPNDMYDYDAQDETMEEDSNSDQVTSDCADLAGEEDEVDSDVPQEAPSNSEPVSEQNTLVRVTSDLKECIYEGSELTVASSCLLLKKFRMQHRLTDTAFADLLRLISLHCPRPNKCPTSPYLFDKQFGGHKLPMVFHNFCSNYLCDVQDDIKCPNPCCGVDLIKFGAKSQFIEVPIEPQLTAILQHK